MRPLAPALLAAALSSLPSPAPAQIVPRLVDYPVTRTSACATDASTQLAERHSVTVDDRGRHDELQVFAAKGCSQDALLFTLDYHRAAQLSTATMTPTARGVGFLQERCTNYAWHAGETLDVTQAPCSFVLPTLGSL